MVRLDHDQIAMKGFQRVRHAVRFEVSGIRMRHWMRPEKSAQVGNYFKGVALYVDTKNRIGKIRIPVAAPTSSCKGVKLAVDESDIRGSIRISRGQTPHRRRESADSRRAHPVRLNPRDPCRRPPVIRADWRRHILTSLGHRLRPTEPRFREIKQTVWSERQPARPFESVGNHGPAGRNRRSLGEHKWSKY